MALRGLAATRTMTRVMASGGRLSVRSVSSAATAAVDPASETKPNHLNSMVKVADVIAGRGEKIYSAAPHSTVFEAIKVSLPFFISQSASGRSAWTVALTSSPFCLFSFNSALACLGYLDYGG